MEELFRELSVGYLTGNISQEEINQFISIYKSSPDYVKIFDEIESAYTSGLISRFEADKADNFNLIKDRIRKSKTRRIVFRAVVAAASVLLLCAISLHLASQLSSENVVKDELVRYVANEDKTQVILPDGSLLWLKSGSELTYDNDRFETERVVTLKGEACFDIRHNQHNPFIVKTGIINIKVLGTIFNVKVDNNNAAETTLARGSVLIQNNSGEDIMFLKPDQQVYFENGKDMELRELNSWDFLLDNYGTITIPDAELSEIIGVIEREYNVDISILHDNDEYPAVTFGFSRGDKFEDVISRLQMVSGCRLSLN